MSSNAELETLGYAHNFATVTARGPDSVDLAYDLDTGRWPWLALPPDHPVLIEKYQYFSAMTASFVAGVLKPGLHSALTRFSWRCESPVTDYATTGHCRHWQLPGDMGFELCIAAPDGARVCEMSGTGFAFSDRDFVAWRARSRDQALSRGGTAAPDFAAPERLGLGPNGVSFISELEPGSRPPAVTAQVSAAGGFNPAHPFHTGTGDHVNAAQLMDCALQFVHLLSGQSPNAPPRRCLGGAAQFQRYVELDVPFTLCLEERGTDEQGLESFSMLISQAGRDNCRIGLRLATPGN